MIKKIFILLAMVFMLSACGPTIYDQQAQLDAQRTYQNQYPTQSACFSAFPYPGDCYMGAGGIWYSPLYYPWGAVIHYNHVVGYGLHVPVGGGVWVRPSYHVNVNYGYARTYISQRSTFYHTNTTYNASTRTFTPRTTVASRPSVTTPYRSSYSSTPSRPTVTAPTRGSAISTFSSPRPSNVSRINWGSSGNSSRSSSSSSSYRSSGSSYRSSSSSSSSGRRR